MTDSNAIINGLMPFIAIGLLLLIFGAVYLFMRTVEEIIDLFKNKK